ncbi:hypothetical protein BJY20_001645 [Janibacter cremeus]|uniref:Uncharacterized protein n=1 Tax=Janibacter cremeus TaxID=1285192 RepID=A0A852VUA0_9MICO|nr:hypothetical protein [Janibacter cremeus]
MISCRTCVLVVAFGDAETFDESKVPEIFATFTGR